MDDHCNQFVLKYRDVIFWKYLGEEKIMLSFQNSKEVQKNYQVTLKNFFEEIKKSFSRLTLIFISVGKKIPLFRPKGSYKYITGIWVQAP